MLALLVAPYLRKFDQFTVPDFIGTVDNMKNILKMPYSEEAVTMAVYRVGRTLVMDGADHMAADLSKLPAPKLDPFGLAPDLSLRVAGFADDFNRAHAEDSLVRSLLLQYSRAAAAVCGDAAATAEQRRDAILRIADLLKHDKRLMRAFLELLPPAHVPVVTPTARGA